MEIRLHLTVLKNWFRLVNFINLKSRPFINNCQFYKFQEEINTNGAQRDFVRLKHNSGIKKRIRRVLCCRLSYTTYSKQTKLESYINYRLWWSILGFLRLTEALVIELTSIETPTCFSYRFRIHSPTFINCIMFVTLSSEC